MKKNIDNSEKKLRYFAAANQFSLQLFSKLQTDISKHPCVSYFAIRWVQNTQPKLLQPLEVNKRNRFRSIFALFFFLFAQIVHLDRFTEIVYLNWNYCGCSFFNAWPICINVIFLLSYSPFRFRICFAFVLFQFGFLHEWFAALVWSSCHIIKSYWKRHQYNICIQPSNGFCPS